MGLRYLRLLVPAENEGFDKVGKQISHRLLARFRSPTQVLLYIDKPFAEA